MITSVIKAKPAVAKGKYIKSCYSELDHGAWDFDRYDRGRGGGEGVVGRALSGAKAPA